jgi:hypothetical protein
VDFVKAFDTVQREALWARVIALGLHGKVLSALKAMYARVHMRVKLSGKLSAVFDSLLGVKQGDPLSPVLFGMFIELMPEWMEKVHQSSPHLFRGAPTFPKLDEADDDLLLYYMLFADDLTLMATVKDSLQRMLYRLQEFSDTLGLEVSIPKTEVIVFARPDHRRTLLSHPDACTFQYKQQVLRIVSEARYVGMMFADTGKRDCAVAALRASGTRARHALQAKLRQLPRLPPAMQVHLFNHLVRPVLSYGCQVWGADFLRLPPSGAIDPHSSGLKRLTIPESPLERVQTDFLRSVLGVGHVPPNWVVLQELGADPLQVHWATCILRFWNELRDKGTCMAARVARADLAEMARGFSRKCWSWCVCAFLAHLGLVPDARFAAPFLNKTSSQLRSQITFPTDTPDFFWNMRVNVDEAVHRLRALWRERIVAYAALHPDPRECKLLPCFVTYVHWAGVHTDGTPAPHALIHSIPRAKHICLMRFRVGGWHHLAINAGRINGSPTRPDRRARICRKCAGSAMEDNLHVALECPYYDTLRARFPSLFANSRTPNSAHNMRSLLQHPDQSMLADYLFELRGMSA